MKGGQTLVACSGQTRVECAQQSPTVAGQAGEIGVGDLAMSNDATQIDLVVTQFVPPELVEWVGRDACQTFEGLGRRGSLTQGHPDQGTLGDGTGGVVVAEGFEPQLGGLVVNVTFRDEGNQHAGVEEYRHSSSSRARTSSEVMGPPPRCRTFKPVRGLIERYASDGSIARRISRATASLSVEPVSRAMAVAIRCRSSGKSMVVRIIIIVTRFASRCTLYQSIDHLGTLGAWRLSGSRWPRTTPRWATSRGTAG